MVVKNEAGEGCLKERTDRGRRGEGKEVRNTKGECQKFLKEKKKKGGWKSELREGEGLERYSKKRREKYWRVKAREAARGKGVRCIKGRA